jgi:hypothetical protein
VRARRGAASRRAWASVALVAAVLAGGAASPVVAAGGRPPAGAVRTGLVVLSGSVLRASWVPVPAVDAALVSAGWEAQWDPKAHRWSLSTPAAWSWRPPKAAAPATAPGAVTVVVDGISIGALPPMEMVDPLTAAPAPYFTLEAIASLFARAGLASAWTPAGWGLRAEPAALAVRPVATQPRSAHPPRRPHRPAHPGRRARRV